LSTILLDIIEAFTRLDLDATKALTKQAVQTGIPARTILEKGLSNGLDRVGELFANQEYFLAELMVAAYIMENVMPEISEKLKEEVGEDALHGKIVFGTVEGDFHFIGKNIAISLLQAAGYEVYDIGEDVQPDVFVQKVQDLQPDIVALSALLLTTVPGIGEVIDALKQAGLRKQVFIMIGGRPTSQQTAEQYGADAYCETAMDGVATANKYMMKKRREQ
jgi:5-methyltetrahydrofolate--homocysteine methyltransferase